MAGTWNPARTAIRSLILASAIAAISFGAWSLEAPATSARDCRAIDEDCRLTTGIAEIAGMMSDAGSSDGPASGTLANSLIPSLRAGEAKETAALAAPAHPTDVDCGGTGNAIDALIILRHSASLSTNLPPGCVYEGDVDCSGGSNSLDALQVLRYSSGLDWAPGYTEVIGTSANDESMSGTPANDVIFGLAGDDSIDGQGGDDKICGGPGDDTLQSGAGSDKLIGGPGESDLVSYLLASSGVTVNLANGTAAGHGSDELAVEWAIGSPLADNLIGSDRDDVLIGAGGNDTLQGAAGDTDILVGGSGDDALDGGGGSMDIAYYLDAPSAIHVNLALGSASGHGVDTFDAIEGVFGSSGNDTLTGDDGVNVLFGGPGQDSLDGGGGFDLAGYLLGAVQASLATGSSAGVEEGSDGFVGMEGLLGWSTGNTLTGDATANLLVGGPGVDTLSGGDGADLLFGQAGQDQLNGQGADDLLDGGDGADSLNGGSGSADIASYFAAGGGITADLSGGTVIASEGSDSLVGVEGLEGSGFGDSLGGDGFANFLYGGAGNDTLSGLGGADSIYGGAGDDNLSGGDQDDLLDGEDGTDTVQGGPGADACYGENTTACEAPAFNAEGGAGAARVDVSNLQPSGGGLVLQLSPLPDCRQTGATLPPWMYFRTWTPAGVPYLENSPGVVDIQTVFLKMHFYRWEGASKTHVTSSPAGANDWFATEVNQQTKPHSKQSWVYLQNGSGDEAEWYVDFNQGYDYSHAYSVEFEIWWLQISTQTWYGPVTAYPPHKAIDRSLRDFCLGYNYIPYISVDWGWLFRPVAAPGIIY